MFATRRLTGVRTTISDLLVNYRIEIAMFGAFVLLCAVLSVLAPRFLTSGNINNLFWQATTIGIIAVGQTLIILTAGIDLSVGGIAAIATMVGGIILLKFGLVVGVAAIVLIGALAGYVNGSLVAYAQLAPFIVTLGVQSITRSLTYVSRSGHTLTQLPSGYLAFGRSKVLGLPLYVVIFVGMFVIGHIVLTKTKPGRYWYAIGSNEEAARLGGVNVRFYKCLVYVITGVLCAIAGLILTSRLGAVDPDTGSGIELDTIAAVVIGGSSLFGGKGSLIGTFIGVFIITVLHNGLNLIGVSPFWQGSAVGSVIILSVLMDRVLRRNA